MINRRDILVASAVAAGWPLARAEQYPNKPIKLIYNFAPGGPGDAVSRYLAQRMGVLLGQPVVVENRTGGGGAVGLLAGARAAADGYTFLYTTVTGVVQVPLVTKDASFDPLKSVMPIGGVGTTPLAILAHPSLPVNDFPSFVEWARKQPTGVDIAGAGPIIEIATAVLARETRLKLVYVAYRGNAPALQAVLAGDTKVFFNVPSAAVTELIKAGKLKVIGVTSAQPTVLFPGGQPISRYVPGYVQEIHFALYSPPGIPAEAAAKVGDALRKVLAEPGIEERFFSLGLNLQPLAAEEVTRVTARDVESIRKTLETTPVKFGD
jgi:tripartite-type tricarboxylate transporter receptor subunit TctC